jgi:hypothetical protein
MRIALVALIGTLAAAPQAFAGDTILPDGGSDDLWNLLDDLPPHHSTDLSINPGFAAITYWKTWQPPYLSFGARFVYGNHTGEKLDHRYGVGLALGEDGAFPEYMTWWAEPQATYDRVVHRFQYGVSVGPSVLMHQHTDLNDIERKFALSPMVSARVGWSQPWSRVQKRMFVVLEPKIRWVANEPNWTIAVAVGSSHGW